MKITLMENFAFALVLSLFAGLATTVGCVIAFIVKKPSPAFLSLVMGFSAGVMLLISFVELLAEGIEANGYMMGMVFFFLGMLIMLLIDSTISHQYELEDSIEIYFSNNETCEVSDDIARGQARGKIQGYQKQQYKDKKTHTNLEKISLLVFLGVFIHNFPEGMATFIGTVKNVELGILLATAIALHNIPEGIAVSVPIYICTDNRKKAFFWSFLSGISEFFGALLVGLILYPFINEYLLGAMLAVVAGIMVYISLDELLPISHSLGKEHMAILGIMIGMFVMAISLLWL